MKSNIVRISERPAIPASFLRRVNVSESFIVPTPFPHELIPNVDFTIRRLPPFCEAPIENLLVRSAFFHAFDELTVIDLQEIDTRPVKAFAQVRLILARQFAFRVHANLVEHPAEIDEPAHFCAGAPNGEIFHRWLNLWFASCVFESQAEF